MLHLSNLKIDPRDVILIFLCGNHRSVGESLNCLIFYKMSGLCQMHALPRNLLGKLGEVFKNNFLTAMKDQKRRIKAATSKNRCHTISERSLSLRTWMSA